MQPAGASGELAVTAQPEKPAPSRDARGVRSRRAACSGLGRRPPSLWHPSKHLPAPRPPPSHTPPASTSLLHSLPASPPLHSLPACPCPGSCASCGNSARSPLTTPTPATASTAKMQTSYCWGGSSRRRRCHCWRCCCSGCCWRCDAAAAAQSCPVSSSPTAPPCFACLACSLLSHEPHFCLLRESGTLESVMEARGEGEGEEGAWWSPVRLGGREGNGLPAARGRRRRQRTAPACQPRALLVARHSQPDPCSCPRVSSAPSPCLVTCRWASSHSSCCASPPCETSCAASLLSSSQTRSNQAATAAAAGAALAAQPLRKRPRWRQSPQRRSLRSWAASLGRLEVRAPLLAAARTRARAAAARAAHAAAWTAGAASVAVPRRWT